MAKRVFFSFHYQDVADFRANVVRQSWVTQDREEAGFFDASIWESSKKTGESAIKRLIDNNISGTSHTVVLIGEHTFSRRWVRYEIFKSLYENNGLTGVHINLIKGKDQRTKSLGENPFNYLALKFSSNGNEVYPCEWNGQWVYSSDIAGWKLGNPRADLANQMITLSNWGFRTYCWVNDNGFKNFGNWIS